MLLVCKVAASSPEIPLLEFPSGQLDIKMETKLCPLLQHKITPTVLHIKKILPPLKTSITIIPTKIKKMYSVSKNR